MREGGRLLYEFQCECGAVVHLNASAVIATHPTLSCGCYKRDQTHDRFGTGIGDLSGAYMSTIKANAIMRGMEFDVTAEFLWKLFLKQKKRCALSGVKIVLEKHLGTTRSRRLVGQTASLDRIDSNSGYVVGNVQWVHKEINLLKSNYSERAFIYWCRKVAAHNG